MSRHVASHRWADLHAGRLDDRERDALVAHAEACPRCARERARVLRASDSFATITAQPAPELPWDSVRARIHWAVSKAQRDEQRAPRRASRSRTDAWLAAAAAAGAITVAAITPGAVGPVLDREPATQMASTEPVAVTAHAPRALVGLVNRSAGELLVDGARAPDLFARDLGPGTVLATGDGRLDVQFGPASAFALGPRSTIELRRFDEEAIELVVAGTIDLEVEPRRPGQRFVVIAGEHTIEVRGTAFRVERDTRGTRVACRHGLVAVRARGGSTEIEVGTARTARIATGAAMSNDVVVPLGHAELGILADATPLRLPFWDPGASRGATAPLEIAAGESREVRLDGVELGAAPLVVRVMPGRHTVEAADRAGRYRRAGWVDVASPGQGARPARLEVRAESTRSMGIPERRRQLRAGIDPARLAQCTRSIAKAGVTDTYVDIEISVDASGAIAFLNIIDTDLPTATATCVRDVLSNVRFVAGPSASWREKIEL